MCSLSPWKFGITSTSSHSARSLVEQLARFREDLTEDQDLQHMQSDLGLGNHFMSGFYR